MKTLRASPWREAVYTHVVGDNRIHVTRVHRLPHRPVGADEQKAAFVVVAVVVLDQRVAAVPVCIEVLGIPRHFVIADLVELDPGVVATPGQIPAAASPSGSKRVQSRIRLYSITAPSHPIGTIPSLGICSSKFPLILMVRLGYQTVRRQ